MVSSSVVQWLANGERGLSSETIVQHLAGIDCVSFGGKHHPLDPDDLQRCVRLLERCPELRPSFPRMAEVSPVWRALVEHWDELVALFESEAPANWREPHVRWSAPRTYLRMKELGA